MEASPEPVMEASPDPVMEASPDPVGASEDVSAGPEGLYVVDSWRREAWGFL